MTSIIKAIQTKWATLTFTGKPATLYLEDEIPLETPSGSATTLPLCWVEHKGTAYQTTFEGPAFLTWKYEFHCADTSYGIAESLMFGFLFNGSSPDSRGGFVLCDAIEMPATNSFLACQVAGEFTINRSKKRQFQALRAYEATVPFQVQVERIS
jgi:hypothetical protein